MEHPHHLSDIMTVHRTQISNPHILKKHSWNNQLLKTVFRAADEFYHLIAVFWHIFERIVYTIPQIQISVRRPDII